MSQPIKLFIVTVTLVAISIFAYTYHFQQKNKRSLSKKSNRILFEHEEESGDSKLQKVGDRMQHEFEKIRNPSTLTIPTGALLEAKKATEKLLQSSEYLNKIGVADLDWQNRGPSNVAGRTRAILFDLNDATNNTVFAGGVAAGLLDSNKVVIFEQIKFGYDFIRIVFRSNRLPQKTRQASRFRSIVEYGSNQLFVWSHRLPTSSPILQNPRGYTAKRITITA